jgi:hypothetical protein
MTKRALGIAVLLTLFGNYAHAEDRALIALTSAAYATAAYDARTTTGVLQRCGGRCVEGNPLMRPFAGNPGSAMAFSMGLTSATAYGTYRLKQKGVKWWWVPMAASMAVHVACGIHNQQLK